MKDFVIKRIQGIAAGILLSAGIESGGPALQAQPVAPSLEPRLGAVATPGGSAPAGPSERKQPPSDLESQWGVQVTALRLSAGGNLIDFRYRVLDPDKAAVIANRANKALLIDQASGQRLHVPSMPKTGALRSTATRYTAGKIYTALFTNPGKVVKTGSRVTIAIGAFQAENLEVGE